MTRRRGLGRGLDALIPAEDMPPPSGATVLEVPPDAIRPNPRQPRSRIDAEDLQALAASIREHGVLQPLIVSREGPEGGFILIAGERRLEAARLAGLPTIPVIVREADEGQQLSLALIENLQRTDLNPLEAAEGYRQLVEDFGLSQDRVAALVGKSRAAISNTLRLLRLPPAVREALASGKISEGHARALLALPTDQAQVAALQTILRRELSVRQAEELARRLVGQRRPRRQGGGRAPEETDVEAQLRQALGTKVRLRRGRRGGSLLIHFYSDEELNALIERLLALPTED